MIALLPISMNSNQSNKLNIGLLIGTIIYFIATVLPHEVVGRMIGKVFKPYGRHLYDTTTLYALMAGTALICAFLIYRLFKHPKRISKGLLYIAITAGLIILAMRVLVVINIEAVHFVQYAILAILIFYLTRRHLYVALIVLILAYIDEGYQHFYLTPNQFEYLDFNDILLDQIGMGGGLTMLYCLGVKSGDKNPRLFRNLIILYGVIIATVVLLLLTGYMRVWPIPGEPNAPIQIMQRPIEGFWHFDRKVHKFHIMRPWLGLVSAALMILIYAQLDEKSSD